MLSEEGMSARSMLSRYGNMGGLKASEGVWSMLSETQSIQYLFQSNFSNGRYKKIVLYGDAAVVKPLLSLDTGVHIAGAIIKDYEKKTCCRRPVIQIPDLTRMPCDMVVAVSRKEGIREAFLELAPVCDSYHIELYSIENINLFEEEMDLSPEEQFIYDFRKSFEKWKGENIALYGKGPKTEMIIQLLPDYNIVGILDKWEVEGEYYGKKILTYESAVELKVALIIVTSKDETAPYIYHRIKPFCNIRHISLKGWNGEDFYHKFKTKEVTEYETYFDLNERELLSAIDAHDVISFSLFDVLIMRRVMNQEDMAALLQSRACFVGEVDGEAAGDTRLMFERWGVTPRFKMVEVFKTAIERKKELYIISDTDLPKPFVEEVLHGFGIDGYKGLLLYSEYNLTKHAGLFKALRDKIGDKACMHIGTGSYRNAIPASAMGINCFRVKSAMEMLDLSTYKNIRFYTDNVNDRSMVSLLAAEAFNNPFALYHSDGKSEVATVSDTIRRFVAPLITALVLWLVDMAKESDLDGILFASRDGYLIERLYRQYQNLHPEADLPNGIYFMTSRRAATNAAIDSEEDIRWLFGLPYLDSPETVLADKFGFSEHELQPFDEDVHHDLVGYALAHKELIFKRSVQLRTQYLKYIKQLGLAEGGKYGFYDMVSSGNSQYYLSRFVPFTMVGYYLCWYDVGEGHKRNLPIFSMYTNNRLEEEDCYSSCVKGGPVYEDYAFLEPLLTSLDASVYGFDEQGTPICGKDCRAGHEKELVVEAQKVIEDYFIEYITYLYEPSYKISKEIPAMMFGFKRSAFTDEHCRAFDDYANYDDLGLPDVRIARK